jgi:hypothetical protein
VTRNGTLGITFTPIEGYSATVKAILDGASTVEEVVAELLPIMRPVAESKKEELGIKNLSGEHQPHKNGVLHPVDHAGTHVDGSSAQNTTLVREGGFPAGSELTSNGGLLCGERRPRAGVTAGETAPTSSFLNHNSSLSASADLECIGYETVPRVQENLNALINGQRTKAAIVYFHTKDNPFGNYPSMRETLEGASREKILIRAYGVPTKATGTQFPLFKDNVHVVSLNFFREVEKLGVTRYRLVDPTPGNRNSGRNWFILWLAVARNGWRYYYREWPSHTHSGAYVPGIGDMGPWAVPGRAHDGEKGPAQAALGWSLTRYRDEMLRMEGATAGCAESKKEELRIKTEPEVIFESWMDSRHGNAPVNTDDESTTLIEQMDKLGMRFRATPGKDIEGGIEMINSALYYDVAEPVSPVNAPEMYVVETCPNLIYALKNWTGRDGQHGATKDPIDLVRYAETAKLGYIDEEKLAPRQPWMQQFR